MSKGVIRWEEIESVSIYDCGVSRFARGYRELDKLIGIYLTDPDEYAKKLNAVQKGIMNAGLKTGFAPISIPCNLFDDDVAQKLVDICNDFIRKNN